LFKIHRSIGHPTPNDFGRALRHAGVHRHLVRWAVKEMRCPVREARVKPQTRRPGALPRCLRFNQVVGMDLVEFPDQGNTKILANMLCWGTGFQMACLMPNKTSVSARDAFANAWIKHYGWMELLVTDQGPEFVGREFSTYVAENGCLQHFIDSQSPWQQGRTERAGGSLKENLRDVFSECAIVTDKDFDLALTEAVNARNRYINVALAGKFVIG
jgi:transposase InsO family protein